MIKRLFKLLIVLAIVAAGYAAVQIYWERPYSNQVTVQIARPPAAVYPLLTDPAQLSQWVDGLEKSMPLTQGGLRVGARRRDVLMIGGTRYRVESKVLAFKRNRSLRLAITSAGFSSIADYTLAAAGGGTALTLQQQTRYTQMMGKIFAQLDNFTLQQKLKRDLNTLKQLVESR